MPITIHTLLCCAALAGPAGSLAQDEEAAPDTRPAAIAWYGTWDQALAEARRLRLPILLQSAAPRCSDVPGMW
ncbi:MAG: hypothetical protein QF903_03345 [Planctomycetota bacterium]|jgi:hypothetical protein|nr:hypothetical protein [Planctomycetota bacterium]MDP6988491.1 hypothetical protein [Planctomycetota bacterium]